MKINETKKPKKILSTKYYDTLNTMNEKEKFWTFLKVSEHKWIFMNVFDRIIDCEYAFRMLAKTFKNIYTMTNIYAMAR